MHSLTEKKWAMPIAFTVSLFAMLVLFVCLPHTVFAQANTLGSETPEIICTYTDSNGNEVAGKDLTAGTYDVGFVVKGASAISVTQVTVTYTDVATVASTPVSLLSDTDTFFASEGYVIGDGNIVFGFVSNNTDTSAVDPEGTVLAVFSVTFASDCSADDVFAISDNPNLTFILADYADGYEDEYALVGEFDGYTGQLWPMYANVMPELVVGHTVSGSVVIMTDNAGSTLGKPVKGEYTLDIYSDSNRTDLIRSIQTVESTEEGVTTNSFVIDSLNSNTTYYATLSGGFALTRDDITIIVGDEDIAAQPIPLIVCDFNKDKNVTAADATYIFTNSDVLYDLNGDGVVTAADVSVVFVCSGSKGYSAITIE